MFVKIFKFIARIYHILTRRLFSFVLFVNYYMSIYHGASERSISLLSLRSGTKAS
jgi:hypothetical protein